MTFTETPSRMTNYYLRRTIDMINRTLYMKPDTNELQFEYNDLHLLHFNINPLTAIIVISMIIGVGCIYHYRNAIKNSKYIICIKKRCNTDNILPIHKTKKAKESPYVGPITEYKSNNINGQNIVFRVRSPSFKLPSSMSAPSLTPYRKLSNYESQHETRITIITKVEN